MSGRLSIKAALLLGFGLTLGLWLVAGYQVTRRMTDVQRETEAINQRYTDAQELLSTIRSQVLLGSVYVRDALLDARSGTVIEARRQLEEVCRRIDEAFASYVPVLSAPSEGEQLERLRREVLDFRRAMLGVLEGDTRLWATGARRLLQEHVVPKRDVVLRVSEQVQALNRGAFVQQQVSTAEAYRLTQRSVWRQLGVAVGISLAIALMATVYAGRLERHLRVQRGRDAQNTRDLERLSAKLINAQEEERRNIARELHDEVGQALMAVKVELAVAQRTIEANGASGQALIEVREIADGALQTVRDLSHVLHPAVLDDLGLRTAIEWYARGFAKRQDMAVTVLHEGMGARLAPQVESAAYRIVQEAMTNIVKHAQATRCVVHLQRLPSTMLITVEDNGIGFLPDADRSHATERGLGLLSIRERLSYLGGTLRIDSRPGHGARLIAAIPLADDSTMDRTRERGSEMIEPQIRQVLSD